MTAVKITVVKRTLQSDLVEMLGGVSVKTCDVFREGQEFIGGFTMPEGFCAWAWTDISKMVVSLMAGASFDKGLFEKWMKDGKTAVACCTDGFRPVIFKLERIETNDLIDLAKAERPAPRDAYGSERWGEFSYAIPGLKSGAAYRLRLHFCEVYHQGPGKRRFDVYAGGSPVLRDFDIAAEAGGPYKAIVKEIGAVADQDGRIFLRFAKGLADNPKISAIELIEEAGAKSVLALNCGGGAIGGFAADDYFEGGNAAGA